MAITNDNELQSRQLTDNPEMPYFNEQEQAELDRQFGFGHFGHFGHFPFHHHFFPFHHHFFPSPYFYGSPFFYGGYSPYGFSPYII